MLGGTRTALGLFQDRGGRRGERFGLVEAPTLASGIPIQRSAWKGYSPKLVCSILHTPGPAASENSQ
jgi:hypothetical protein